MDALSSFKSITGSTTDKARQYLNLTEGNLEQGLELYFANDSADLEIAPQAPNIPPTSSRPSRPSRPYQDEGGVVHVDSESDLEGSDNEAGSGPHVPMNSMGPPTTRLNAGEDDEAMARRLQEEFYGSGTRNDNADVRAPIARTTETLVGPGAYDANDGNDMHAAVMEQLQARRQPRSRERPGIFNQTTQGSIWNDSADDGNANRSRLARATAGASESSSKATMLAEMYRPPFEIMYQQSWEEARNKGKFEEKWLLVNIQDPSIFDCQVLNRDIWKNSGIKETVKENFVFMQYSKDDPRGRQYTQYYFHGRHNEDAYPHIAILDPRTGEQLKVWSGLPAPKAPDFLMQLHEFLDRYSLKATAKNPVAKRKSEAKKGTEVEKMTEEQMLEMAMQNSLAPAEPSRKDSDPDDLTRSVGHLEPSNGKVEKHDELMEDVQDKEASSPVASAFGSISSSAPHVEPPSEVANTRIQFRHPNGRIVRRFALSEPVRRIYEWLKASPLEGKEGATFELVCMGKNLLDHLDDTIEVAGLKNSSVMVEFLDA